MIEAELLTKRAHLLFPAQHGAPGPLDYAVDAGCAHLAVFDGIGPGVRSSQVIALAVSAPER